MSDRLSPLPPATPRAFVLVHGAWHGPWCWERVVPLLAQRGHRVLTPELGAPGFASDRPGRISLQSHVEDVLGAIAAAPIAEFELVGHSYAGIVISAVADSLRERIVRCTYLDAAVPPDMSAGAAIAWSDFYDPAERMRRIERAREHGSIAAPLPSTFGVTDPDFADWLQARLRPMALETFTGRFTFRNGGSAGLRRRYIAFTSPPYAALDSTRKRVQSDPTWSFSTLGVGHDAMLTAPESVAEVLAAE